MHERERRKDEERAAVRRAPAPAAPSPVDAVLALQRSAGNASVGALLARAPAEEVQSRDAVVEPHTGGGSVGVQAPEQADAGDFDWLTQALGQVTQTGAPATAPPAP